MDDVRHATVRCPVCGAAATAHIQWRGEAHLEVVGYDCPTGCRVDDETVRQLLGAQ